MRIVDRKTFLAMPEGTIFAKYEPCNFGELLIKGDTTPSGSDFIYQDIIPWPEGCNDTGEWIDMLTAAENGSQTPPLDFECSARDGLFDEDQRFAVFDRVDAERLIARLQQALTEGYPHA